jgi:hypothetical protein
MVSGPFPDTKESVELDFSQIGSLKRLKFQGFKTEKLPGFV